MKNTIPNDPKSQWFYVSDSYSRQATETEVLSCEAYLLFYVKEDPSAPDDASVDIHHQIVLEKEFNSTNESTATEKYNLNEPDKNNPDYKLIIDSNTSTSPKAQEIKRTHDGIQAEDQEDIENCWSAFEK